MMKQFNRLDLEVLPDRLAIHQFRPDVDAMVILRLLGDRSFYALVRTKDELSLVCQEGVTFEDGKSDSGWRALKVLGPLDFSLTGILNAIAQPLAEASISIFALSTYDTDYVLVKEESLLHAIMVLKRFHNIQSYL